MNKTPKEEKEYLLAKETQIEYQTTKSLEIISMR